MLLCFLLFLLAHTGSFPAPLFVSATCVFSPSSEDISTPPSVDAVSFPSSTSIAGFTVMLSGVPISHTDSLLQMDLFVPSVPTSFLLQLYTMQSSTGQPLSTPTLKRSLLVQYDAGSAIGMRSVSMNWPVVKGDRMAIATDQQTNNKIILQTFQFGTQTTNNQRITSTQQIQDSKQIINQYNEVNTVIGSTLRTTPIVYNRKYRSLS